jgi:hypothetical protein
LTTTFADGPCKKCDVEKVKAVNDSINRLTRELLKDFLCTFDKTCDNNAEFSEWSNETLFLVMVTNPDLFLDVVSKDKSNQDEILHEVKNPLHDLLDLQKTYDAIKSTKNKSETKKHFLTAILAAGQKGGVEIRK